MFVQAVRKIRNEYVQVFHRYRVVFTIHIVSLLLMVGSLTWVFATAKSSKNLQLLAEIQSQKVSELARINKDLFLSQKNTNSKNDVTFSMLSAQIRDLLRRESAGGSISSESADTATAMLTTTGTHPINVYIQPTTSSGIIEVIPTEKLYFYSENTDGWYKIELDAGKYGWINSKFAAELSQ